MPQSKSSHNISNLLILSPEVKQAIANNKPVVALESTIISHGMPYPINVKTAEEVEEIVRSQGAVPATMGIIDGKIHAGLTSSQLEFLGNPANNSGTNKLYKVASFDLGYMLATKASGGTTVSATMLCAELAGIKVFATGGIGGVHKGAEQSFDISSDLTEFTKTPVIVVSAGCKSILDIPKTLEYLETLGVPVVGFNTEQFPAFHSQSSGISLTLSTNNPKVIAEMYSFDRAIGKKNGILVANPIPKENEIPSPIIAQWISSALAKMNSMGVSGKKVTPFLLADIAEKSQGKALAANIALVKNNALVASQIAIELASLPQ